MQFTTATQPKACARASSIERKSPPTRVARRSAAFRRIFSSNWTLKRRTRSRLRSRRRSPAARWRIFAPPQFSWRSALVATSRSTSWPLKIVAAATRADLQRSFRRSSVASCVRRAYARRLFRLCAILLRFLLRLFADCSRRLCARAVGSRSLLSRKNDRAAARRHFRRRHVDGAHRHSNFRHFLLDKVTILYAAFQSVMLQSRLQIFDCVGKSAQWPLPIVCDDQRTSFSSILLVFQLCCAARQIFHVLATSRILLAIYLVERRAGRRGQLSIRS